jgi:hypothetical protein
LKFVFIANNASHKFEELRQDENVNVAFLNPSTTAWASYVLSPPPSELFLSFVLHISSGLQEKLKS